MTMVHSNILLDHHLIHLFHSTNRDQMWGAPVTCCLVHVAAALKFRPSCIYVTQACKLYIDGIWHILPSKNMCVKRHRLLHTLIPPLAFMLLLTVSLDLA